MFKLGKRSKRELAGVHEDLVQLVEIAIQLTNVDFTVLDGLRTREEQAELVRTGASETMNSRHLTGHAVDLVPYINRKVRWEWEPIFHVAEAMQYAANEKEIPVVWGGAWSELLNGPVSPKALQKRYIELRQSQGRKPFLDGPHFELSKSMY